MPPPMFQHPDRQGPLDGLEHYRVLGLQVDAKAEDVKQAFRLLARRLHPDKGGSTEAFAAIQTAFEVLSDARKRAVYDAHARDVRLRKGLASEYQAPGGEDALLRELQSHTVVDPLTQLVVTCEMCRRPATQQCWTCGMDICAFCTRRQHWKGSVPLHWPLVDAPGHMLELLGKQEMEKKRLEDGQQYLLQLPGHRSQAEQTLERQFREADAQLPASCSSSSGSKSAKDTYCHGLARFYMWAQTPGAVHIAVFLPTGAGTKGALTVDCHPSGLLVQTAGAPPVINRHFAHAIDPSAPISSTTTPDGRLLSLSLTKAVWGQEWRALFRGDSDGARCLRPPYRLVETGDEVLLELGLPGWVVPAEDVVVDIGQQLLRVEVDGGLRLQRTYWSHDGRGGDGRGGGYEAVRVQQSSWSVSTATSAPPSTQEHPRSQPHTATSTRRPKKLLSICLARPELTREEVTYKKGVRQDNRATARSTLDSTSRQSGWRFFTEDEDEFGLEDILQALCFAETGSTYMPAKPWSKGSQEGRVVTDAAELGEGAKRHLETLAAAAKAQGGLAAITDGAC